MRRGRRSPEPRIMSRMRDRRLTGAVGIGGTLDSESWAGFESDSMLCKAYEKEGATSWLLAQGCRVMIDKCRVYRMCTLCRYPGGLHD
jgi:hypothetical protein